MLKFLRKYNTFILVIGGAFLMVAFLVPQAIQQLGGNPMTAPIMEAGGKKFGREDLAQAERDIRILATFGSSIGLRNSIALPASLPLDFTSPDSAHRHWMLLVREAELSGLVAGPEDGVRFIDELGQRPDSQIRDPVQRIETLYNTREQLAAAGFPIIEIDSALARASGVTRLYNQPLRTFEQISSIEAAYTAERVAETAIGQLSLIPAASLVADIPDPTGAELQQHFEKYLDLPQDDNEFGISYQLPPAVRVQTLTINRNAIRDRVTLDPVDVRVFWQRNQGQYGTDFVASRTQVENALKDERSAQMLRELQAEIRTEILRARRGLTEEDGYYELPADWNSRAVDLKTLADKLNVILDENLGEAPPEDPADDLAPPVLAAIEISGTPEGEWSTIEDLRRMPPRFSRTDQTSTGMAFPDLVMSVRALDPETDPPLPVQIGVLIGPLSAFNQSSISFFRVTDVRPAGPAPSLDVVRDQAIENYKLIRAFEMLTERTDSIRASVVDAGNVATLSAQYPDAEVMPNTEFDRSSVRNAADGRPIERLNIPALRDAVMETVTGWPLDQIVSELPNADRTVVVPIPDRFNVYIVYITARYPGTIQWARQNDTTVLTSTAIDYQTFRIARLFMFDAIAERLKYKSLISEEQEEEMEAEQAEDLAAESAIDPS